MGLGMSLPSLTMCATYLGCSAVTCTCSALTSCCDKVSEASARATKGFYLALLFFASAVSLLLRFYGSGLVYNLPGNMGKIGCVPPNQTSVHLGDLTSSQQEIAVACMGNSAVYRM